MPSLDDVIRENKRLVNELTDITEKLSKNEALLGIIKGDKDNE